MRDQEASMAWRLGAAGVTLAAGLLARQALTAAWRRYKGTEPPDNPTGPDVSWPDALTWAGATGVAVGVARVVAKRGASAGWRKATGNVPPGMPR